jgi:hypothetical protein
MRAIFVLIVAGLVVSCMLCGGIILAQGEAKAPAQPAERVYSPVTPESIGTTATAANLAGAYVKLPDYFFGMVNIPEDALPLGITPDNYVAFRTRPFGSNLICFLAKDNPDAKALLENTPVQGAEIYIMGRLGQGMFVEGSVATRFDVDRVVMGHREPASPSLDKKKAVTLIIERPGPGGVRKQEVKIPEAGKRYVVHDPLDPTNTNKDIYVTVQF